MASITTATTINSTCQDAINKFKTESGMSQKDIQDLERTTLLGLQQTLSKIQNEQKNSRKLIHLKRLQPFLQAMEQYGEVIGVFVNTSNLLAFIWGPLKFLLLVVSNFSEAFSALLDGYYKIGRSLPVLLEYHDLIQTNPFLREALFPIFEDILEFHTVAVKYFRQKTWKTVFQATWNHVNKKIIQLSNSLEQQRIFFESAVRMSQYKDINDLRIECQRNFRQLENDRIQARNDLDRRNQQDRLQRREQVQQWLGALDSSARHEDVIRHRHPGTGEWILTNPTFQTWYAPNNCSDPLLWLSGKPGAGKTVLSSYIIEELRKIPNATVAFFYCKQGDGAKSGFLAVAKALCSQILARSDDLLLYFYEKVSLSGQMPLSDTKLAKELLEIALKANKNTYIVIDGLDEYSRDDRKEIATWLQEAIQSLPIHEVGALRCLFVSQEDGYAKKDLSNLSHIRITATDNKEDIRSYSRLWHDKIGQKFRDFDCPDITNLITARAQGMFLYARLVLNHLWLQTSDKDLEEELDPNVLPNGFEEAYGRIIARLLNPALPQKRISKILKLLGWLACAKRPLKWYEVQAAMSVDVDQCIFDQKSRFVEDSKDLCASLVEICSDGSVTLVHSTAREFLVQTNHIRIPEIDTDLASLCLTYLSLPVLAGESSDQEIKQAILQGTHAFFEYAISFWGLHLEDGLRKLNKDEGEQEERLEMCVESLEEFFQKYWRSHDVSKVVNVSTTLRKNLQLIDDCQCFEETLLSIAASRKALRPMGKNAPLDTMLSIYQTLIRSRKVFESMASFDYINDETKAKLEEQYGLTWFKCSRLNCRFFHQGFLTNDLRQRHEERHERSYICSEEGCPQSIIGCTTAKDLENHMWEGHGIGKANHINEFPGDRRPVNARSAREHRQEKQTANEFPDERAPEEQEPEDQQQEDQSAEDQSPEGQSVFTGDQPTQGEEGTVDQPVIDEVPLDQPVQRDEPPNSDLSPTGRRKRTNWECTSCQKRFTRNANLQSHLLSHTNERPFVCTICRKTFRNKKVLKRHERNHLGEKKYVCKGRLDDGTIWGCGNPYARAEELGKHFESKAGKLCIQALVNVGFTKREIIDKAYDYYLAREGLASKVSLDGVSPSGVNTSESWAEGQFSILSARHTDDQIF